MATSPTLRAWLGTLEPDELALILERHAVERTGAHLRGLDQLAIWLEHPAAMWRALKTAPLPILEVIEVVSALGEAATISRLTELLADDSSSPVPHEQSVRHWVGQAATAAMMWLDGDQVHLNPGIDRIVLKPLCLTWPARRMVQECTAGELRAALRGRGLPASARKAELAVSACAAFSRFDELRRLAATAPPDLLARLHEVVDRRLAGAHLALTSSGVPRTAGLEGLNAATYDLDRDLSQWAAGAGLAIGESYGLTFERVLPSEVFLALAPARFRAPFHPEPPAIAGATAPAEQVQRTASAAATEFVGAATAILESLARAGLTPLKAGGIGSRELNRLAKQLATDVATVRLTLESAAAAGLVTHPESGPVTTTPRFQDWRRLPPHHRALDFVAGWQHQSTPPTRHRDSDDTFRPALHPGPDQAGTPLGAELCRLLVGRGEGAVISLEAMRSLFSWHNPLAAVPDEDLACAWQEAHVLGVLADGALTPLGAAVAAQDNSSALASLEGMLPAVSGQVLFGSDLTVMVPGTPDPTTVDLLDTIARREGHGVANTWRLSEASVRAAFDAGYVVDDLLEALRAVGQEPLPQAMEYLLRDVARKHGHLSVQSVAALITAEDEGLLAEVAGEVRLRGLGLRVIAPTVLVTTATPAHVLAELRGAGYLPIERGDDGAPVVEIRRLEPVSGSYASEVDEDAADLSAVLADVDAGLTELLRDAASSQPQATPQALARRLLGSDVELDPDTMTTEELAISRLAGQLMAVEVRDLAAAVTSDEAVLLTYRSQHGSVTSRVVSHMRLSGPHVVGYCHTKRAERHFRLERILRVTPAE